MAKKINSMSVVLDPGHPGSESVSHQIRSQLELWMNAVNQWNRKCSRLLQHWGIKAVSALTNISLNTFHFTPVSKKCVHLAFISTSASVCLHSEPNLLFKLLMFSKSFLWSLFAEFSHISCVTDFSFISYQVFHLTVVILKRHQAVHLSLGLCSYIQITGLDQMLCTLKEQNENRIRWKKTALCFHAWQTPVRSKHHTNNTTREYYCSLWICFCFTLYTVDYTELIPCAFCCTDSNGALKIFVEYRIWQMTKWCYDIVLLPWDNGKTDVFHWDSESLNSGTRHTNLMQILKLLWLSW